MIETCDPHVQEEEVGFPSRHTSTGRDASHVLSTYWSGAAQHTTPCLGVPSFPVTLCCEGRGWVDARLVQRGQYPPGQALHHQWYLRVKRLWIQQQIKVQKEEMPEKKEIIFTAFLAAGFLFPACICDAQVRFVFYYTDSLTFLLLSWTMVVLDLCLPLPLCIDSSDLSF